LGQPQRHEIGLTALILAIDIKHEFLFALDEVDHTLRADGDTQGDDDISY